MDNSSKEENKCCDEILRAVLDELKCSNRRFICYSILVVIVVALLGCAILCLSNILVEHQTSRAPEVSDNTTQNKGSALKILNCCCKTSLENKSKQQCRVDSATQNSGLKNNMRIGGNISISDSDISFKTSHSTLNAILWLIGFLIFSILALILSIPIYFSSQTNRYIQFYLDCKELSHKRYVQKQKKERTKIESEKKQNKEIEKEGVKKNGEEA